MISPPATVSTSRPRKAENRGGSTPCLQSQLEFAGRVHTGWGEWSLNDGSRHNQRASLPLPWLRLWIPLTSGRLLLSLASCKATLRIVESGRVSRSLSTACKCSSGVVEASAVAIHGAATVEGSFGIIEPRVVSACGRSPGIGPSSGVGSGGAFRGFHSTCRSSLSVVQSCGLTGCGTASGECSLPVVVTTGLHARYRWLAAEDLLGRLVSGLEHVH